MKLPAIDLTKANLLFEKQASGLYLPRWQEGTGGSANVTTQATSVWSYGPWPQHTRFPASGATAATGTTQTDNTVVYTSGDISSYNYHTITNTSATDDVDVFVSDDGVNFNGSAAGVTLHDSTGAMVVSIPAGKIGILEGKFFALKVQKNGVTAETPSIRYAHSVK